MAVLSKTELLKGVRRKRVALPDGGGEIYVREISTSAARKFIDGFKDEPENPALAQELVREGVCRPNGKAMFGPDDDIDVLSQATIVFLATQIAAFSGFYLPADKKNRRPWVVDHLFAFDLCRELGFPHPDYLFEALSLRQYNDWMIAYGIEPWGERRADIRSAQQAWATFQVQSKKRLDLSDFILKFRKEKQTDYRSRAMGAWAAAGGGLTVKK